MTGREKIPGSPNAKSLLTGSMPQIGALFDGNQRAMTRWFEGMLAIYQEVAQFAQYRLQEDTAAWLKLIGCRSPSDALECQKHFAERTSAEYSEEAVKLSEMMVSVATQALSPQRQGPHAAP